MNKINSFFESINTDNQNNEQQNPLSYNDLLNKHNNLVNNYNCLLDNYNNIKEINIQLSSENEKLKTEITQLKEQYQKFENNKGKGRRLKKLKYDVVELKNQGLSYREIARLLNVSVSTVYARIKKAEER